MTFGTSAILLSMLLAGMGLITFGLLRARSRAAEGWAEDSALSEAAVMPAESIEVPDGAAVAAEVAARVEGMIAEQTRRHSDALASLKADIQHLKSDVEWLAGERMIEQAIALAQTGLEADDIGRELGLTLETAETIAAFRKH